MTQPFKIDQPDFEAMFERFRREPGSQIFAPLADACRKAGMLEEALEICEKGLAANPTYASGYVVQGKCLYDSDRPRDAEASFRRVLTVDPHNLVALKYLGIIHAERGESAPAREYFEHILVLDPGDRDIKRRLDEVGEPQAAPAATPADVEDADEGAEPLDLPEIEETFEGEEIVLGDAAETDDEIATMTLADIYASQGYDAKALRIYHEILRRQPDNDAVRRRIEAVTARRSDEPAGPATPAASAAPKAAVRGDDTPKHAAASQGAVIDETRSYEQFKRWLRSVSD